MKLIPSYLVAGSLCLAALSATAAVPLPALNVDTTNITVDLPAANG